jgi:hypothetical protein
MGDRMAPDRSRAALQQLGGNTIHTFGWPRCGVLA